jgi:hypothetical protein
MSARINEMLRGAKHATMYADRSSVNRHLLGMIQVLSEEIDAIRAAHPAHENRPIGRPRCSACGHAPHESDCGAVGGSTYDAAGLLVIGRCPCTMPTPAPSIPVARIGDERAPPPPPRVYASTLKAPRGEFSPVTTNLGDPPEKLPIGPMPLPRVVIDAARAIALADAVRAVLKAYRQGEMTPISELRQALEKFEAAK